MKTFSDSVQLLLIRGFQHFNIAGKLPANRKQQFLFHLFFCNSMFVCWTEWSGYAYI